MYLLRNFIAILFGILLASVPASASTHRNSADTGKFPKLYVLTLDRTPQRYEAAAANLKASGVDHIKFSATDGYLIEATDLKTQKSYNGKTMWAFCHPMDKEIGHGLKFHVKCDNDPRNDIQVLGCRTPGEIGVFCSMKRIWRDIYDKGYDSALILEDDSRILPKYRKDFKSKVSKIFAETPFNKDVLFLHLYYAHEKIYAAREIGSKKVNKYVVGINKDPEYGVASCAAYIVHRSFVTKMLEFSDVMDLPVDLKISDAINKNLIKAYKAKEQLIRPDEEEKESEIKKMGRNDKGELL